MKEAVRNKSAEVKEKVADYVGSNGQSADSVIKYSISIVDGGLLG